MVKEYGYEYEASLNYDLFRETEYKTTNAKLFDAHCLCSGRDALKAISREFEPCNVMLPALACDSMIIPFRMYGHRITYYELNEDYSIKLDSLEKLICESKSLFLYMDYFGNKAINDSELIRLRKENSNIVFIEDRTHTLLSNSNHVFKPDYVVASLRKWIAIPDGGLLWGSVTQPFESDTLFSSTRLKAQIMRHEYLSSGEEETKITFRKIFQNVSNILDSNIKPVAMSEYSYFLAANTNFNKIRAIRKRNADILLAILSNNHKISIIQDHSGCCDLYVPFMLSNRDEVQRKLSSEGVFNTIIWPLNELQKQKCFVSKFTEENMLAAPCDQRYSEKDMRFIGKEIVRIVESVNG